LAQQLRLAFEGKKEDIGGLQIGIIQSCVDRVPTHIIQVRNHKSERKALNKIIKFMRLGVIGLNPDSIKWKKNQYRQANPMALKY
jgi:hypothetical protein